MDDNWKFNRLGILAIFFLCHGLCLSCSLNDEGLALLSLKEKVVSDPFGSLSNWNGHDGEVNPCSWFGVECSDGKVVVLNLKDLCLEGTLTPELRSLVHIKSIILRNNSFSGLIPEGLGDLKELEVLDLGYNNFSGPLPPDLGNNLSLAILLLDNNGLLGGFTPEIYELQILSESQVDENQLSPAAKGSSGDKRFITRNADQTEDTVHRKQLQEVDTPLPRVNKGSSPSSFSTVFHFFDPYALLQATTAPPPDTTSSFAAKSPSASTSAAATPSNEPPPNQTLPTPNMLAPPPAMSPPSSVSSNPKRRGNHEIAVLLGSIGGAIFVLIVVVGIYLSRNYKVATVKPWATGLSGQLQRAFVTGVPKLKRSELEAACEDFSNVICSSPIGTVYKGTLSSGVEIAVASFGVTSAIDWSRNLEVHFRKKIDTLSKVNHKNFVNLIGYCEEDEPFTRMMVFEYAPNGTLFDHIHVKESEHLDWGMRLRIAMGMAYCLEHMHQLSPPVPHNNLTSSSVNLTEDYAAKVSDLSFWNEITAAEIDAADRKLSRMPSIVPTSNVYSFGVILFEMITGRLPYAVDNGSLGDWASDYLRGDQPLRDMVDPTLKSFDEDHLDKIEEVIKACVHPDPRQRPAMREVTSMLREITTITPDGAIPKLSPLWWAELEILSTEGS